MTIESEIGLGLPFNRTRRPGLDYQNPNTGVTGGLPRPLYPETSVPVPKPPVNVPPKPPYPVTPIPVPKPPVNVPPKPPYPVTGTPPTTPQPTPPGTAGQLPSVPGAGQPGTGLPGTPGQPPGTPGSLGLDFMRQVTPNELVANQLNDLLSQDSAYMRNARLRGTEQAASRGLANSSIAAGASQRAALEAAMPIAQADANVYREANAGNFAALNDLRQMRTAAELDNWLGSESFNREYNGQLAMIPIQSAADFMGYLSQRALEDPAVWTPDVVSGWSNFFTGNFQDVFSNFFGNRPGGG
jgi:hypothetical protein